MEKTVTISLKKIAEHMVASFQLNNEHDHMEHCSAYKLLLSDEDFNEVVKMCTMMVHQNNIKKIVK